jgi:hypothetical protein
MSGDSKNPLFDQNLDTTVWTTRLDRRYTITVHWRGPYRGELSIRDGATILHREPVGLMYGAIFGPDVEDVATWKEMAVRFVDGLKETEGD